MVILNRTGMDPFEISVICVYDQQAKMNVFKSYFKPSSLFKQLVK